MKTLAWFLLLLPLLFAGTALAGESGNHYPSGVEGIDAASVPPPGFYIRNYSFFYTASKLADGHGQDLPVQAEFDQVGGVRRPERDDPLEGPGQGQGGGFGGSSGQGGEEQAGEQDQRENGRAHGIGG